MKKIKINQNKVAFPLVANHFKRLTFLFVLLCSTALLAQKPSLKVGDNPATINTSAALDAESTTKGFLTPRMTTAQRDAIVSPAKGLVLYNISLDCLQVNKGTTVAPTWECIGASAAGTLVADCPSSRFSNGTAPAQDPLCNGLFIGVTGYQVKFVVSNNSFVAINNVDFSSAVTLSGTGAAGLTVTAGQNNNVTVGSGASVTLTYNLAGSPTTAGAITANFNRLGLTCAISNTVANQATWAGNSLDGTSSANANVSCLAIKNAFPASANGVYWIDPDGACTAFSTMQAQCDMTTDGGGWTLVLNYLHAANNTSLPTAENIFPLITSSTLGTNESAVAVSWGHANNTLMTATPFTTVRFFGLSSSHSRQINFKTSLNSVISYFKTGSGTCNGIQTSFTPLSGHNAVLPAGSTNFGENQGNKAMTEFTFMRISESHWALTNSSGTGSNRWEADDFPNGPQNSTIHRIWVR